jgi:hypothetical protein
MAAGGRGPHGGSSSSGGGGVGVGTLGGGGGGARRGPMNALGFLKQCGRGAFPRTVQDLALVK